MARPKVEQPKTSKSIRLSDVMISKAEGIATEKGYTSLSDWIRYLIQKEIDNYENRKPQP